MTPFELVFAAFAVLLGLAIAEVLGGFSRVLKLRRSERARVRIGWLTPLLGLFVVLDLTRFWLIAWNVRDLIPVNYLSLVSVLAIVGTYYVAATLIFPEDPEEWPDFDAHYDKHNRIVLGGMLGAQLGLLALSIAVAAGAVTGTPAPAATPADAQAGDGGALGLLLALLPLLLIIALLIVKKRALNIAFLAILIAIDLLDAVSTAFR